MKTTSFLTYFSVFSAFASGAAQAQTDVAIAVTLKPAGSFVAKSSDLQLGRAIKTKTGVEAQNIVLSLDSLKTGVELRDTHMKSKYFETQKYPKATLVKATGANGKFTGELQVHNTVKPVSGTYEFAGNDFKAHFKTHLSDFNISAPKYMGIGVQDEVEVDISLPAQGKM